MKKWIYAFIFVFLISAQGIFSQSAGDYVPNELLVMLQPGNAIDDLLVDLNDDGLAGQYKIKQVVSKRYRIYLLEHDAILGDSKNLVYDINKMDQVALAQLNHYIQERLTPNDPGYATDQRKHGTLLQEVLRQMEIPS
jgi:hypothetical protein